MLEMLDKIRTYIEVHHLLDPFQPVAVALSGGADSVALLHVLHRLGYQVTALHCNFHLRSEEADRDQHFVEQLCQDLNIPLRVKHFDTTKYAKETSKSLEMAARDLRYRWFAQESSILNPKSSIVVATGHHQDDQAETLLLNLIRGTGLRGLRGMLPCRDGIIRPLLCVSRKEILAYLDKEGLDHVEDSTNQDTHIRRNLIRHQLIPLLRQLNPSIVQTLSQEAEQFQDYYTLAQERLEELAAEDLQAIAEHPASETILYNKLQPYGFQPDVVRQLAKSLNGLSGKLFHSEHYTAEIHRGQLLIYPRDTSKTSLTSTTSLTRENIPRGDYDLHHTSYITDSKDEALFDADKLRGPLTLRHWQQGDTFAPFGMHGRRQKVSDYFTNHHFSLKQKEETQLLLCNQEIAWIIGHRTSDLFRIDDHTQTIAHVTISPAAPKH